jgi:hypothetical protein
VVEEDLEVAGDRVDEVVGAEYGGGVVGGIEEKG